MGKYFPDWFLDILTEEDRERAERENIKTDVKFHFICPKHGVFVSRVGDIVNKTTGERKRNGCDKCGKESMASKIRSDKYFPKWFIDRIIDDEDRRLLETNTIRSLHPIHMTCPEHGDYVRKYGHWAMHFTDIEVDTCPRCGKAHGGRASSEVKKKKLGSYPSWFIDLLVNEKDKELARTGELSIKAKVELMCPKHGIYTKTVNDIMNRTTGIQISGCQKCNYGGYTSKMENEVVEYLRSIGIYEFEQNQLGCLPNKNYELDINIPDHKLAIEVNGCYYHATIGGSEQHRKLYNYHKLKCEQAREVGIRLISVFDVDWNLKRDLVKSVIRDALVPCEVMWARKTVIKAPSKSEVVQFLTNYHIQGYYNYKICYGLYYNGDLVSLLTIGSPRYTTKYQYELLRYAVKSGLVVKGGFEKLLSRFKKDYSPKSIVSYSDNDFFTGNMYARNGFEREDVETINYFWTRRGNDILTRDKTRPSVLKDKYPDLYKEAIGNKEDYIMSSLKYMKVYRSGNQRWVWNKE